MSETIRLAIGSSTFPPEQYGAQNCFDTGMPCWSFDATYGHLYVVVPIQPGFPTRKSYLLQDPMGLFQGARLLDWDAGIALADTGENAAIHGGNSGESFWHIWRLSFSGETTTDGSLIPFTTGVVSLGSTKVIGAAGVDSGGVEDTPFRECHACPHVSRQFAATWDHVSGQYQVRSTEITPSAYATLVSFVRSVEGTSKYIDSTTGNVDALGRLHAILMERQSQGATPCDVGSQDAVAITSKLELVCATSDEASQTIEVTAIRRGSEWYLQDAYAVDP